MDAIDEEIETTSMSITELKNKLAQKDKIEQSLSKLDGLKKIDDEIKRIRDEKSTLHATYKELSAQKEVLNSEIDQLVVQTLPNQNQVNQFIKDIKELTQQDRTLSQEIQGLIRNQKALKSDFYNSKNVFYTQTQESKEFTYEKNLIYQDAERVMFQIQETERQIGEIKTRTNPNIKNINSSKALVSYLETLVKESNQEANTQTSARPTSSNKQYADMIASVRGAPKKKGKKTAHITNLSHPFEAVAQFSSLDLIPPKTIDQIPDLIKKLKDNIQQMESSFFAAELDIQVNPNGTLLVHIKL